MTQYICPQCGATGFLGMAHTCKNSAYYSDLQAKQSTQCQHCFCKPVDNNGMIIGKLDHVQCCMCGTRRKKAGWE